jgi:hypothetical protein
MHKVGGKWTVKQHCKSAENAHIVMANLEKLDKHPNAKVFGPKKASRGRR